MLQQTYPTPVLPILAMLTIKFYLLSPTKNLLSFVCQLTQTVLQKSPHPIRILADIAVIEVLDKLLWAFSSTAFIPHSSMIEGVLPAAMSPATPPFPPLTPEQHATPVLLTPYVHHLDGFAGVIINLTAQPLLTLVQTNQAASLVEVVPADELSQIHGKNKYDSYQQLPLNRPIELINL